MPLHCLAVLSLYLVTSVLLWQVEWLIERNNPRTLRRKQKPCHTGQWWLGEIISKTSTTEQKTPSKQNKMKPNITTPKVNMKRARNSNRRAVQWLSYKRANYTDVCSSFSKSEVTVSQNNCNVLLIVAGTVKTLKSHLGASLRFQDVERL